MTTPHQGRTPSPSFTPTPRAWRAAAAATLLALLAACGGGGGGGTTPAPTPQARTLVGPQQVSDLTDTCLNNPSREGDAQHACYGVGYSTQDELQLRSDGSGGLLIKTLAARPDASGRSSGRLARISPTGTRSTVAMPQFYGPWDVASDGTAWMIHTEPDATAGEIRSLDPQGQTRVLARFSGVDAVPAEGPLNDPLPGAYTHIAAGGDSVFLWQSGGTSGGPRPVVRLRRDGAGAWQVKTIALPPDTDTNSTLRFRSDAQDRLWMLLDRRCSHGEVSWWTLACTLELRRWSENAGWQYRGGRNYHDYYDRYLNSRPELAITDFSPHPDGSAVLSGGYPGYLGHGPGALYAIDAQGQWKVLLESKDQPLRMLQQQGNAAQIPVDGVFGTAVLPDGRMAFINPMANRIQLFDGTRLSVLSGESWSLQSAWERLANMRLLGFFSDGRLLIYPRQRITHFHPGVVSFQAESGLFDLLNDLGSYAEQCFGEPTGAVQYGGKCNKTRLPSSPAEFNASTVGPEGSISQEATPRLLTIYGDRVEWQSSSARGTLTANLSAADPGTDVLASDADAHHLYAVKPQAYLWHLMPSPSYNVYRLPLSGGTWEVVAASRGDSGAPLPVSAAYGRAVDLSSVRDAKHLAVRADGGLWLANDSQLWLISKTGELRLVAGRARPDAATPEVAVDSADGAAVRFGQIERVRALPDGRALVVDSAGHAVRSVTEQGQSATLVGTLNQSGAATTALPGRLNQPVDALATAGVLYITEKNNPQMSRVSGVLP